MQLETVTFVDWHHRPPPSAWESGLGSWRVAPFATVNPSSFAPSARYAQRTAPSPLMAPGSWEPPIIVTAGPLTLSTVSGVVTVIRLVSTSPGAGRPPV